MTFLGISLSILSGVLLALSFTPWGVWPLAWVGLVPLFAALLRLAHTRVAFGLYCALAAVCPLYSMAAGLPPGYTAVYALPAAAGAAVFMFTFWQKDMATRNRGLLFPILAATGITALEFVRHGWILGTFASLGLTQYAQPACIQIASLLGVFGVSFMLVCANAAVALFVVNIRNPRPAMPQIAGAAGVAVAFMALNLYLLQKPLDQTGRVTVAAVQLGFIPEAAVQHPDLQALALAQKKGDSMASTRAALDILEPMTRRAAQNHAQIVVWPETVLDTGPDQSQEVARRIAKITLETKVYLVFGYAEYLPGAKKNDPSPPYKNMAAVADPEGRIIHRYHKQRYVRMAGIENGPQGAESSVVQTPLGTLAVMICYDADYPETPPRFAAHGGEIFLAPSHDLSGFLTRHHPSMLLFRAVENRRSMAKSDYVNGTFIADARGRILADPPDGPGIVTAEVPLVSTRTPQPWGQLVFGWACTLAFAGAAITSRFKQRL
jgi:apolipoprotein N-acyltransferase